MLSVLILGLGLVIIANSYLVALRGVNTAQNNIQAMVLVREKMDELELSSVLKKGLSVFSESDTLKSLGKTYGYSLEIAEMTEPEYMAKNIVQTCLAFSWEEKGVKKNATVSAYFPKYQEEKKPKSI